MAQTQKTTHPAPTIHRIHVGDRVRSFAFPQFYTSLGVSGLDLDGERACYVEGEVVAIVERGAEPFVWTQDGQRCEYPAMDCDRYAIRVTGCVRGGERGEPRRQYVFPPVNGTPQLFADCDTFGVQPMGDSLDVAVARINAFAADYQRAEGALEDAAYALQQAQDRFDKLVARSLAAQRFAADVVKTQVDRLHIDEADDAYLDAFGFFASEAS